MSPPEAARRHAPASRRFLRRGPALDWPIILYAALALAAGWAYASLRIQADHHLTLDLERNQLRSVTAALQAGTQAMLNDGIGAAIAGANAVMMSHGDMDSASAEDRAEALSRMPCSAAARDRTEGVRRGSEPRSSTRTWRASSNSC